jgi:protein SCO1/2
MLKWFGCLVLALGLVACDAQAPLDVKGADITHAAEFKPVDGDGARRLALTDHNGRPVTLATFKGKVVVLFFGYTHCPDVCPTTLSDMAQALKMLRPEDASKIQVLFASVDPERDTPEILRSYVPYFHPDFLGLYGTPDQVARAAREFRVVYRKHVESGANDYLVDHSAGSYVIDAKGSLRLYLPFAIPPKDIAHDLSVLLKTS